MLTRCILLSALFALLFGCADEKQTTPLTLSSSGCKSNYLVQPDAPHLLTVESSADYLGFSCISWKMNQQSLEVDLINFSGGCADYDGAESTMENDELSITVVNRSCAMANCETCVYDWSVQVDPPTQQTFDITVAEDACPSDSTPSGNYRLTATVTPDTLAAGRKCEYKYEEFQADVACGTLHAPCFQLENAADTLGDADCGVNENSCGDGMACFQNDLIPTPRCIATCTDDTDCPMQEMLSCQKGYCLLR